METAPNEPRIFIEATTDDQAIVERLRVDLAEHGLGAWLSTQRVPSDRVGDIGPYDYVIAIFSVPGAWDADRAVWLTSMAERGAIVVLAWVDGPHPPDALVGRRAVDFRARYDDGLDEVLCVLGQERVRVGHLLRGADPDASRCVRALQDLKLADLRRRLTRRLARPELAVVWYDVLESRMEDDMSQRLLGECVVELLLRVTRAGAMDELIRNLCADRPDLERNL